MLALTLLLGLVLLVLGGDVFVRGAVATAERLGVPTLVIGLTLVGFGTSLPELATSVDAALRDAPGIAVGNVVGSNIANILLILGAAAVMRPVVVGKAAFRRDGTVVFLSTVAAIAAMAWGEIDRAVGGVFVAAVLGYVAWCYLSEAGEPKPAPAGADVPPKADIPAPAESRPTSLPVALGSAVVGLALVLFGARLLVDGAITLATLLGISETVVGLTVVAVGTSLPELATTVAAALKRETDVAFGNVLGSNIFNVLFILGATGLVTPIAIPPEIMRVDVWVMLAATLILLLVALTGTRITRWEGTLMLAGYGGYMGYLAATSVLAG